MNFKKTKIILASQSPRRSELMKQAGFEFEVIASDTEEKTTECKPDLVVTELSRQKSESVLDSILHAVDLSFMAFEDLSLMIIGADTIVCKDKKIMGKPKTRDEAYEMLHSIQGQTHQVYTGVTIIYYDFNTGSKTSKSFFERTDISLYPMSDSEINHYIATGDCYDKAGGYGIQGAFAVHVKEINGDYNNVVGLPIARLYQELKTLQVPLF